MASPPQRLFILIFLSLTLWADTSWTMRRNHYVHWNTTSPIFRIDNTDHIIDVNKGNLPFEYDQVNIICPYYHKDDRRSQIETYLIYSVSKEEYESCRIKTRNPRIIAQCTRPHELMFFTISFRSFTPTPGGLEFKPGRDYYFISTSSADDLRRRVGGRCSTHNMKVQFKVADNDHETHPPKERLSRPIPEPETTSTTTTTTMRTRVAVVDNTFPYGKLPMYYDDLSRNRPYGDPEDIDFFSVKKTNNVDDEYDTRHNEVIKHEASRMAATAASSAQSQFIPNRGLVSTILFPAALLIATLQL